MTTVEPIRGAVVDEENMKFVKKVCWHGNALSINIPKDVRDAMCLERGMMVVVDVRFTNDHDLYDDNPN